MHKRINLKFDQIPKLTTDKLALSVYKMMLNAVTKVAHSIIILPGNEDNHVILDEFKIRPDSTSVGGVCRP